MGNTKTGYHPSQSTSPDDCLAIPIKLKPLLPPPCFNFLQSLLLYSIYTYIHLMTVFHQEVYVLYVRFSTKF